MSELIIALDYADRKKALELVDKLNPEQCALKTGSEMFTLFGPSFVQELIDRKFKVFLDLKFHDIPNTVARACTAAADLGVWMVNVHASGGLNMMEAAMKALQSYGKDSPLLIAVTVLTSMPETVLKTLGIVTSLEDQVLNLAALAKKAGLDGVVCAAAEATLVKNNCGKHFLTVTPGIRLDKNHLHDQVRVVTPLEAQALGSDYLVIGRPVTEASNPMHVITNLLSSMK